jgi:hypothetical protein
MMLAIRHRRTAVRVQNQGAADSREPITPYPQGKSVHSPSGAKMRRPDRGNP